MRFGSRDLARVPSHWLAFDSRRSQLSSSPRKASTPINAFLNYLYGILEAESRLALQRVGCDAAMGLIHADRPNRSEEHTSELQSHSDLVCRLLLEKKKTPEPPPHRPRPTKRNTATPAPPTTTPRP